MALVGLNVGNAGVNANAQTLDVDEVQFLFWTEDDDTLHF